MKNLKFLLRGILSAALILLVLHKVNWTGLGIVLSHTDARWLLAGSLTTLLLIIALATRWRIFLRQQGIQIRFSTILSLTWAGQFFNSVLPGSTGGDVVKIYQLCRLAPHQKAAAAATVLTDRLSALVAMLVLAGTSSALAPAPLQVIAGWHVSLGMLTLWFGVALAALATTGWLVFRFLGKTHWLGRVQRTLAACTKSFEWNRHTLLAVTMSFGIHFLTFFIVFLFARSLGIGITYAQVTLFMPILMLLVMLPITVNGHGLRELLLIFYFTYFHIASAGHAEVGVKETVIALSVLLVTNDLLWAIPGGIWYFLSFKRPRSTNLMV